MAGLLCAGELHGDDKVGRDACRGQRSRPRARLVHGTQVRGAGRPVVHLGQEEHGGQCLRVGATGEAARAGVSRGACRQRTECISRGLASATTRLSSSQRAHSRYRPVTTTPSSGTAARNGSGSCDAGVTMLPAPPCPAAQHHRSDLCVSRPAARARTRSSAPRLPMDSLRLRLRLRRLPAGVSSWSPPSASVPASACPGPPAARTWSARCSISTSPASSTWYANSRLLIAVWYLRACRCRTPVRKPCGKKNAGRWNNGGSPRRIHRRMNATRSRRSSIHDASGFSDLVWQAKAAKAVTPGQRVRRTRAPVGDRVRGIAARHERVCHLAPQVRHLVVEDGYKHGVKGSGKLHLAANGAPQRVERIADPRQQDIVLGNLLAQERRQRVHQTGLCVRLERELARLPSAQQRRQLLLGGAARGGEVRAGHSAAMHSRCAPPWRPPTRRPRSQGPGPPSTPPSVAVVPARGRVGSLPPVRAEPGDPGVRYTAAL